MTILIFLIVLGILVFVHELGHFLTAKKAGVEVKEFGFGYPPRAMKLGVKWGTLFSLNWIPFGGFVKIVGEDYEDSSSPEDQKCLASATGVSTRNFSAEKYPCISELGTKKNLSFVEVSKKWQAGILASGVIFNILFAWLLFSIGFSIGLPTSVDNDFGAPVKNPQLTVIGLAPDSPAQKIGLKTGDIILNVSRGNKVVEGLSPEIISDFVSLSSEKLNLNIKRGKEMKNFEIIPTKNIVEGKNIIGINTDMVGTLSLPPHKAIYEGGRTTLKLSYLTIGGIANLIKDAVMGKADLSQVAGPVGIVGLVGDASRLGFSHLLTFTALISINLAIINLIPFPALDGGRILFVIIEGITKKKINPKIAHILNTIGFFLLIALMLIVTYRDILKLF